MGLARGGQSSSLLSSCPDATHIKKPQPGTVGASPHKLPPLSLERTSQRWRRQVSWLAALTYSLHLPEMNYLSGFRRFRSAHSCGAATDLHHLPWSQYQAVTNPSSDVFDTVYELMAVFPMLSRIFLRGEAVATDTITSCVRCPSSRSNSMRCMPGSAP